SDVYAMGGTPLMAIAILGWPVNQLPAEVAGEVLAGGRVACEAAGIPLAGGHSIDSPEPIFGLAVSGLVELARLKRNSSASAGSLLYLTKPLGVGILTTALKKGLLKPEHLDLAERTMLQLNKIGALFGTLPYVQALTDVTGFGLLGHLCELAGGSGLSAEIEAARVPRLEGVEAYIAQGALPGGIARNWASYGAKIAATDGGELSATVRTLLCDPQTSGGLLAAVSADCADSFEALCREHGLELQPFGRLVPAQDALITVA
ncbi:MAG: selenide, water dikinase SelD, partial [Candidatus Sericytochromatia bacterium]